MNKHLFDAICIAIGITIGWMIAPAFPPPFAFAQGPMEQVVQTNVMRDQFRAQLAIAKEFAKLNATLRRIECLERSKWSSLKPPEDVYCAEGAKAQ